MPSSQRLLESAVPKLPAVVSLLHYMLRPTMSTRLLIPHPLHSGHTAVRCKEPAAGDNGADGGDAGASYGGGGSHGMETTTAGGDDFPASGGGGDSFANAGGDDGW